MLTTISDSTLDASMIRRQLGDARDQLARARQERDSVALRALSDHVAAHGWHRLDDDVHDAERRIAILTAALPVAEQRERDAAERAEAAQLARQAEDYARSHADASAWLADVLERLPSADTLTAARNWRNALRVGAYGLDPQQPHVRRPLDPLGEILIEMQRRIAAIERMRWLPRDAPIRLKDRD